ncbi:MAG: LTA synthase family protein, partial [Coriobacteriales bacterium]|nr:LTA synthase family protein [Coriobacteriales bacterium]
LLQISGQAGTVLDSVGDLFKSAMLFAFVSLPIVAVAAVLRWRTPVTRAYAIGAVVVASLAAFGVAASTSSLLSIGSLNDAVLASRARGIVAYEIASPLAEQEPVLETEAAAADTPTFAERVDELLQVKNASRRAPVPHGIARDKDVIVVQVEALQTLAIGSTINGREVTPNFNKLARDSWYFPNTISLIWLGNTSDAEFVANTGLMPSKNEPSSIVYGERVVPSLPRRLNDLGYTTETFHANAPEYWNRAELYPSLGFDRFYAQPFFGEDDIIGMGPSDDVLFEKAMERVKELRGADKRYYMDLITLSSHHPFKAVPTSREPIAMPDEWRESQTGRYLNAEHYADAAFGRFMDELKAEGVLDDTIVIVYGDHFGLSETKPKGARRTRSSVPSAASSPSPSVGAFRCSSCCRTGRRARSRTR